MMKPPKHFKIMPDHALFDPAGNMTLPQAVKLVTSAITFARENKIRRLLVNTVALTGFNPPTVFDRYAFAEEWALAARGALRLAVVARAEIIDPEKIGVVISTNRGLANDVFTSEAEALAWLLSDRPGSIA